MGPCMHTLNSSYLSALRERLAPDQLIEDISRRRAYATDASFYQLTPLLIVHLDTIEEVQDVLALSFYTMYRSRFAQLVQVCPAKPLPIRY